MTTDNKINLKKTNTNETVETIKINEPTFEQNIIKPLISTNPSQNPNPFQQDSTIRDASQLTRLSDNERALYETYTPME